MGLRGVDIQVAIQRAAEANKIQQGEAGTARAGEAGAREEVRQERIKKQEQPQKPDRSDEAAIQARRDRERRQEEDKEEQEALSEDEVDGGGLEEYTRNKVGGMGKMARRRGQTRATGHIDILA